ncbi:MAG: DUF559 domain-containing protein [Nanoarchaeota archaeon]
MVFKKGHKINLGKPSHMLGKKHKEESKIKTSLAVKESHKRKEYGFKKGVSNNRIVLSTIERDSIIESYLSNESIIKMSRRFKHSRGFISKLLKERGIKVRKNSEGLSSWNAGRTDLPSSWNKGIKQWKGKIHPRQGKKHSKETIIKLRNRKINEETIIKIKKARAIQITPLKDTSIEVKIQNYLKELKINFFTHQYIKEIEHGYQCDILVPYMNLVIECDGDYWHKYPIGNELDHIRTKELIEKGFKVLRLWEFEINQMSLDKFKEKLNDI